MPAFHTTTRTGSDKPYYDVKVWRISCHHSYALVFYPGHSPHTFTPFVLDHQATKIQVSTTTPLWCCPVAHLDHRVDCSYSLCNACRNKCMEYVGTKSRSKKAKDQQSTSCPCSSDVYGLVPTIDAYWLKPQAKKYSSLPLGCAGCRAPYKL